MLYIVTGNKSKFEGAKKYLGKFGISVSQKKIEIIEPQEEDIKKIAEYKAGEAFKQLKKPLLVHDAGWYIPSLKGFPGPYMHSIVKWLNINDFLRLLKPKKDRTIFSKSVAVYIDSKQIKFFYRNLQGKILTKPKGKGIYIDQLVTFRKNNLTIAQCDEKGIPSVDEEGDRPIWEKVGKWMGS